MQRETHKYAPGNGAVIIMEGIDRMKAYKKIMDGLAGFEKFILVIVCTVVTVITFANVVVRYLTPNSFAWTEELVVNLFVLMVMLGCALCARDGTLISLSLVFDRLKAGGKKVFVIIITIANCAFFVLLLKTGVDKVLSQMASHKETFSLRWPEWVFTIFLPIGAVFLLIHTIEFLIDVLRGDAACIKELDEGGND